MTKYEQLKENMVVAMKNHDKETLSTIRMLKSAIDLYKINNKMDRFDVPDEVVIEVSSKQVKTHKESIIEFLSAGRKDLAEALEREIKIISQYLPTQLSEEEVRVKINEIFDEVKPEGMKDMGKIMSLANEKLKGMADFKLISEIVKEKLN